MTDYWNQRFKMGKVWGSKPSGTSMIAADYFSQYNKRNILVIGSGYGRNANFFHESGYHVEGIEYAWDALVIAQRDNPYITYYHGSIFDIPCGEKKYSAIYCYNVMHLFLKPERNKLIALCQKMLEQEGLVFFSVFSDEDKDYGIGNVIEENTFEQKPGKPVHYYSKDELTKAFGLYSVIHVGEYEEYVGNKECKLRYIVAKI